MSRTFSPGLPNAPIVLAIQRSKLSPVTLKCVVESPERSTAVDAGTRRHSLPWPITIASRFF